jgi:Lysyl oxidase
MTQVLRRRRATGAIVIAIVLAGSIGSTPAGAAAALRPSVRLVSTKGEVTMTRRRHYPVPLDIGVFVASIGAPLEIRARRAGYRRPIEASQILGDGTVRALPADVVDGWSGLAGFLRIKAIDDSGALATRSTWDFCPAGSDRERVDDSGPAVSVYPSFGCGSSPFTLGEVWGIDRGWANDIADPYGYYGDTAQPILDLPDGHYLVHVSIRRTYRDLFSIPKIDASVTVGVTLDTSRHCRSSCYAPVRSSAAPATRTDSNQAATATGAPTPAAGLAPSTASVPIVRRPDRATLPNLIPLPAWGMGIRHDRRSGRDALDFAATVWDSGPAPLVVEGFRRSGSDVMDAYQYFYRDGEPVGRARVGTLEFDAKRGHFHWHFEQFARYSLLDADKSQVLRSRKVSFCLAPTDPIDLTRPGANWAPYSVGLDTACGSDSALWVREVLDAGWGDTYFQYLPGQSFDVTNLPNGRYFVQVHANPLALLHERNRRDDVTVRKVILKGTAGHRRVVVPPWHGIDSDGGGL